MYKIILAVELECSINRTPSPPKRWALSGHWLKGGNVGFKTTTSTRIRRGWQTRSMKTIVCSVSSLANKEQAKRLRNEETDLIVLQSSGPFNDHRSTLVPPTFLALVFPRPARSYLDIDYCMGHA